MELPDLRHRRLMDYAKVDEVVEIVCKIKTLRESFNDPKYRHDAELREICGTRINTLVDKLRDMGVDAQRLSVKPKSETVPGYITTLHTARIAAGHSCRSFGAVIERSYETVSRVESEAKGNLETLERYADALGYDVRLFTEIGGKPLSVLKDAKHIGEQLYAYRRGVIKKPRKAFIRPTLSLDAIMSIEIDPAKVRFSSIERYAGGLGLGFGVLYRGDPMSLLAVEPE